MKRLLLLRHAKSSWEHPGLDDFERPLSPRGRKAAPKVGRYLRSENLRPDRVLCSPARRTEETWAAVAHELGGDVEMEFVPDLYLAPPSTFLTAMQTQPVEIQTLMLVGHNPGTQLSALRLLNTDPDPAANTVDWARMREKVPTGALIEITFDVDLWGEVDWGMGSLVRFVVPRSLEDL